MLLIRVFVCISGYVFIYCKTMVQPEWSLNHGHIQVFEVDIQSEHVKHALAVCNLGHTPNGCTCTVQFDSPCPDWIHSHVVSTM